MSNSPSAAFGGRFGGSNFRLVRLDLGPVQDFGIPVREQSAGGRSHYWSTRTSAACQGPPRPLTWSGRQSASSRTKWSGGSIRPKWPDDARWTASSESRCPGKPQQEIRHGGETKKNGSKGKAEPEQAGEGVRSMTMKESKRNRKTLQRKVSKVLSKVGGALPVPPASRPAGSNTGSVRHTRIACTCPRHATRDGVRGSNVQEHLAPPAARPHAHVPGRAR